MKTCRRYEKTTWEIQRSLERQLDTACKREIERERQRKRERETEAEILSEDEAS